MKRPSITIAISISLAVIGAVVLSLYVVMVYGMGQLNARTSDVADRWLPRSKATSQIEIAIYELRIAYGQHAVEANILRMQELENVAKEREVAALKVLGEYEAHIETDNERASFTPIVALVREFIADGGYMMEMSADNDKDLASYLFGHGMTILAAKIGSSVDQLVAFSDAGAQNAKDNSVSTFKSVQLKSLLALLAVLSILAIVAAYVLRGIAGPVNMITRSMTLLAGGDTTSAVPYARRSDEIGRMASAVEIFRQEAIAKSALEIRAQEDRDHDEQERHKLAGEAEASAMIRLQQAISGIADGLHQMSKGNLQLTLSQPLSPEFDQLRVDLNRAAQQLSSTLTTVSSTASSILERSSEIADSTTALSQRTEEQAAALVQTTTAIGQIAATISNSNRQLDAARELAATANEGALKSGNIVGETVEAMARIEQSSNQISNITLVVNQIAFQTSLLALNAGVEAARAGDTGKGFAVVAQEVRALATRSADAAKEIKALIDISSNQVQTGVSLVQKTGMALSDIAGQIAAINQNMGNIAKDAREQATTLSEVSQSVSQLDKFTQQNTAMVEETSAASHVLVGEAALLRNLMAAFALQHEKPHETPSVTKKTIATTTSQAA